MFVNVEVSIERMAHELAGKNNEEQAIFFNEFCLAVSKVCSDAFHAQMQMASIQEFVKPEAIELLKGLTYEVKK
jgi:hypothetical protein